MPKGGKRPGAGRPKGSKEPQTLAKEMAREALRVLVTAEIPELAKAQFANAKGIKFLMVREKGTGKFVKVTKDAAEKLNPEQEIIEVWEEKPSVEAFKTLMDRALDQPAKPTENLNANVRHEIIWKGDL